MTTLARHIFRAYDIRGVVPTELNRQTCYAIGRALASIAIVRKLRRWAVGYDGRLSSRELADGLIQGLVDSGAAVTDTGLGPTPLLYYAAMLQPDQCGVMITGSHNPKDYNGLKIIIGGESLAGEEITAIYHRILSQNLHAAQGSLTTSRYQQAYMTDVLKANPPLANPLKLVIDSGNGAAGELAPALYRALGCEVIELFCDIDGNFPNHHPDPGKPANLRDLQKAVINHRAAIGFAFDGDGDRLGIVTDKGEIIFPDRLLAMFAEDLLQRHPGATILMDVKCSPLVYQAIAAAGGKPQLCPTGHSLIKRAMQREQALLAGEMSGHMFFAESWNGCDDALFAGAKLLVLLSRFAGSSSQLCTQYPTWQGTAEINLVTTEDRKWQVMEALQQNGNFGDGKLINVDGLRVEYADSWGLVRCSNTTPTLVLRFEGKTSKSLHQVVKCFADQFTKLAPDIDLAPVHSAIADNH